MSPKNKLRTMSLIGLYPIVSTFLMTMIWQIAQRYLTPFMGSYYFKWVFLYTENNPHWLSEDYLPVTRILYFVYILSYIALIILSILILCRRLGKAVCIWCICGLWLADAIWIVVDMVMSGAKSEAFILLAEHFIFISWAILFSIVYLRLKKTDPDLFKTRKRRNKNAYRARFQ